MANVLYINGTALSAYGVIASGEGIYTTPVKDVEVIHVPGRNGDVVIDSGSFQNVEVVYPCYIKDNFQSRFQNLKNFLLSKSGYLTIRDSYDLTHIREGYFVGAIEPNISGLHESANFELTFSCKPQRFIFANYNSWTTLTTGRTTNVNNTSGYASYPLFQVTATAAGTLNLTINGNTIVFVALGAGTLEFDTETLYGKSTQTVPNLSYSSDGLKDYRLKQGANTIATTGDTSKFTLKYKARYFVL